MLLYYDVNWEEKKQAKKQKTKKQNSELVIIVVLTYPLQITNWKRKWYVSRILLSFLFFFSFSLMIKIGFKIVMVQNHLQNKSERNQNHIASTRNLNSTCTNKVLRIEQPTQIIFITWRHVMQ